MSRPRVADGRPARGSGARSPRTEHQPANVLAEQMAVARWAFQSRDWTAYERARDTAIHLLLAHRVEDEMSRFRQVTTACLGSHDRGEDARELIHRKLTNAFQQGFADRETPHDLIVRMHRIPRAAATAAMVSGLRHGDGEHCVRFLLFREGDAADDITAAYGDDPCAIAARFTDRHWTDFVKPLMAINPGELRQDMMDAARESLRRALLTIGAAGT